MQKRPKLRIPLYPADKMLEVAGWLFILLSWFWVALVYPRLPEALPTHFGISGQADAFGPKNTVLILPGIASLLFIGAGILGRFPHLFNYPVPVDEGNALKLYTIAARLIRVIRVVIALIFLVMVILITLTAFHQVSGLGVGFLPAILGLVFFPMLLYLLKMKGKL